MLGRTWKRKGCLKVSVQTVTDRIRGFVHAHGVTNRVTLHRTVEHILLIAACKLDSLGEIGRKRC